MGVSRKTALLCAGMVMSLAGAALAQQGARPTTGAAPAAAPAAPAAPAAQLLAPRDWTTWGYDPERTGWNRGETTLTKDNVSGLKVVWDVKLNTSVSNVVLSTLTAPVVAADIPTRSGRKNLVYLLSADDILFALDADGGKIVWQKS